MANLVTSKRVPGSAPLSMSNGLTDVFFEVLAIAGTDRATTVWEKCFAYWLVRGDQARSGRGCVGFDIESMGWTKGDFDAQKRFVVAVIDAARAKSGWDRLAYEPHEAVFKTLDEFRSMVEAFPLEAAGAPSGWEWQLPPNGMCEEHRVYLHELGCILCGAD
jgi:hypothetical protein